MATTDKPESKKSVETTEPTEPSSEPDFDPTRLLTLGMPARRIVTAEEAAGIKEYLSQPAREPSEKLKAAFRRARELVERHPAE